MDDLANRLIAFTIDWNGSPMSDEAPTLTDVSCGLMRHAADAIESLRAENSRLTEERDALEEGLRWYAEPHIYAPHPNGPAFDDRDLSWHARSVLAKVKIMR